MSTLMPERERTLESGSVDTFPPEHASTPRVIVIRPGALADRSMPPPPNRPGGPNRPRLNRPTGPPPIRLTSRGRRVVAVALTIGVLLVTFLTLQAGSAIARAIRTQPATTVATPSAVPLVASNALDIRGRRDRVWKSANRFVSPISHLALSARFGQRGEHWALRHTGLDFIADWGTPVHSATEGTIIKTAYHAALGNVVVVRYADGITIFYCHLSSVSRHHGHVNAGTVIGRVGATGNATGAHLHLEVRVHDRQTDPYRFLFGYPAGHTGRVPAWLIKPVVPFSTL